MAGYKVKVTGDREVAAQFRALGFKARDLSRVFTQIGSEVARDARGLAPKDSGRLAVDVRVGAARTRASIAVGRGSVPYAGPINYGWRKRNIEPSLFMNRAADSKADSAADQLAREMQRLIDSVGL
jgi:hypothetical protein